LVYHYYDTKRPQVEPTLYVLRESAAPEKK